MIGKFNTLSGSTYEVDFDRKQVRRVVRSSVSDSERVAAEWRPYADITWSLGRPLFITWGTGRDEHSANAEQLGTDGASDEAVMRHTETTPIMSFVMGFTV